MANLVDPGPNPTYPLTGGPGNQCVRAKSGRYYTSLIYVSGGSRGLAIRYSDDGGVTWSAREIVDFVAGFNVVAHSIALDASDNLYVVWAGGGYGSYPAQPNIRCRVRSPSGVWGVRRDVTNSNVLQGNWGVDIDIDAAGKIHIVFNVDGVAYGATTGLSQIFYTNDISYSWPHVSGVNNPFLLSNNIHSDLWPNVLVSLVDGTIHTSWHGRTTPVSPNWYYKGYHRRYPVGGPWTPEVIIYNNAGSGADGNGFQYPSLIEDPADGRIFCTFMFAQNWPTTSYIYECNYPLGGPWSPPTVVVNNGATVQVGLCREGIDQARNRYCYWYGLGWGLNPGVANIEKKVFDFATATWGPRIGVTDKAWACVHSHTEYNKHNIPVSGSAVIWSEVTGNNPVYFEGNQPAKAKGNKVLSIY